MEDFGYLEAGGQAGGHRAEANTGGEVSHTAVTFGDEQHGTKVKGRRVDEDGLVLPLRRSEQGGVYQVGDLGGQGVLHLHLAGNFDGLADGLAGEGLDLGQLVGVEGVAKLRRIMGYLLL